MSKGGPATQEGKEIVRWDAIQHGIRSPAPVVPDIEGTKVWEKHLAGVLESLSPERYLAAVPTEHVALFSWRLRRVSRYETESITLYQKRAEDDLPKKQRFGSYILGADPLEPVHSNLKAARPKHQLVKRLTKLGADKHLSASDVDTVLTATEYADREWFEVRGEGGP